MRIEEMLSKIAEREGILERCIEIPMKSAEGQGFLADISFVCVKGKSKNGEEVILNLINKTAATNEKLRKQTIVPQIFTRELFMYKSVFPIYYSFEKKRGITNPFCNVAQLYGASTVVPPEILILENLTKTGYKVWNRWQQMNDNHVRMVMREYGRFHAISFAIQDQEPELFQKLTDNFGNIFENFLYKSGFFQSFINKAKQAQTSLSLDMDKYVLERYSKFLNGVEDTFQELIRDTDKYFAILHGDTWSNNIMFSYANPSNLEQPDSLRLIDFQLSRLGSPVCDVVHFFYSCASKEVLKNLNNYKDVYYGSFASHLRRLGTDPNKAYPQSAFEEDFRKYAKFGLIIGSLARYAMLSKEKEIVSFSNIVQSDKILNTAFDYEIANLSTYKERMRDVIIHCVENNFL